jgi:arginyl-tRNA synthetase
MSYIKFIVRSWIARHFKVTPIVRTCESSHIVSGEILLTVELPECQDNPNFRTDFSSKLPQLSIDRPEFIRDVYIEDQKTDRDQTLIRCSVNPDYFVYNILSSYKNQDDIKHLTESLVDSRNVVVEFSSPNIAKPFHYGHLRSTIIGNAISNLHSVLNQNVTRINYLGDWGTQFGLLSLGLDSYGSQEKLDRDACKHLLDVYVRISKESENDVGIREEGKMRFASLENGSDVRIIDQWKMLKESSLRHYMQVYERLGVNFDHLHWESMYSQSCKGDLVVGKLRELGILHEEKDGALFVRIEEEEASTEVSGSNHLGQQQKRTIYRSKNKPKTSDGEEGDHESLHPSLIPFIKRDGSSLYLSRDVSAAIDRKSSFNFDSMFYVVESGQHKHFSDLKNILKALRYTWFE